MIGKPTDDVIAALIVAVESTPNDVALRAHLAGVLLDAGRLLEALEHAERALRESPADLAALEVAAAAAEGVGAVGRAAGYRTLVAAVDSQLAGDSPPRSAEPDARTNDPIRLHVVRGRGADVDGSENARLTLEDVGGMEQVKRRLRTSFLGPLENPALRRMYGKSLRGGLLLWGPPGCGKTFIARATAGELGAKFMSVGLHDVLDMWLGESEKNLHEVFQNARRNAPCVLFFDEVDAIGRRRSQLRDSGGREVVVQFLSELDSFGSDNDGVFALAATNHPWDVDPALRRPGRFDRMLLVLPPDQRARSVILAFHLRDRPVGEVDVDRIAAATPLFSGADLQHLCDTAVEYALEESLDRDVPVPISTEHLVRATSEVRPSTLAWLHSARNYAQFAGEDGAYDELLDFLRAHRLM